MKKTLFTIISIMTAGLILKGSGVFDAFFFFIIIGAIPGTDISLSPSMTMVVLLVVAILVSLYILTPSLLASNKQVEKKKPIRRYSKI